VDRSKNWPGQPAQPQAAEVEVLLQTRETPEQLLKWLSSGIHRRRPYKGRHKSCIRCGELIGDGTVWRRAIYHHRRLASDPNISDKEARSAANCMMLHPACHDGPVDFYNLHGFFPDNLRRK
jgi:hypothetical protein